jgi:hypothetical protein
MTYRIDSVHGVVLTSCTGVLTDDDLLAHKRQLADDPNLRPGMVELSDVRGVERLDVTAVGVRQMVMMDEDLQSHRLAIVVSQEVIYGMARMYQSLTEPNNPNVGVFRDMSEARAWLGLSALVPEP